MPDNRGLQINNDSLATYFAKDDCHRTLGQLYQILVDSFKDDFVSSSRELVGILPSHVVIIPATPDSERHEKSISAAEAAKIKLAKLEEWEDNNSTHARILKQRRDFNAKQFARIIRYLIVLEGLQSDPGTDVLQMIFKELYKRLYPERFSCAWPITDADQLLAETADMLINLLSSKLEGKADSGKEVDTLGIYLKQVSTAWPPMVQRVVVSLIVAALIFSVMAALQVATLNITPLMAFQLANLTATSAPQIWAIATPVAAVLMSLAAACLPKYSALKTNRLSDMHRQAQLFIFAAVNSLADKDADAGSGAATSMLKRQACR